MEKDLQVVGFRIGNETYGVRIGAVREIVRVPEITSVPNAPDTIEGVINLRGKIIPVMDLRKRFNLAEGGSSWLSIHRGRVWLCHRCRKTKRAAHYLARYRQAAASSGVQTS